MRDLNRLDNITTAFNEKVKQYQLNASDADVANANGIWLAAYKPLGENSARLILASVNEITEAQAKMAVPSLTNNEMTAYGASFVNIKTEEKAQLMGSAQIHYASVHALRPPVQYVDFNNRKDKCKALAGLQYLDTELDCVWQKKEIAGKPYLYRKNENNLEDILRTCLFANTDVTYRSQSDNFISTANAKKGDFVEFFGMEEDENGNVTPFMDVAQVTDNNGDSLGIEIEQDGYKQDAIISAHAVKNVITAKAGTTRKEVLDYLIRAYGSRFGEILKQTKSMNSPALGTGNHLGLSE